METNKILSALSYFSIFFAGFIVPLVIYLVSDDYEVKRHAKRAFLSHILPAVLIPLFVFAIVSGDIVVAILSGLLAGAAGLVVTVWNVVMGIRVLKD